MIANFFNKTKPIHALFISGLFLVYYILAIFIVEKPEFSFLVVIQKIGLLFLFVLFFFMVRFINRKNYLSSQNSYMLLILAFLFGMFPRSMEMSDIFISHFFLLLAFRRIYSIRTFKRVNQKLFDSGLWIGVATLFYIWNSLFLILIFVAILVHKKQNIRNLIIPIVGFVTPVFLAFTFYYLTDNIERFYQKLVFSYSLSFGNYFDMKMLLPVSVLFALSVLAIGIVNTKVVSLANDLKQSWMLVLFHFFCAIYCIILSPLKDGSELLFSFFPMSIIIANHLQLMKRDFFRELLIYGLLVLSFSVYFL